MTSIVLLGLGCLFDWQWVVSKVVLVVLNVVNIVIGTYTYTVYPKTEDKNALGSDCDFEINIYAKPVAFFGRVFDLIAMYNIRGRQVFIKSRYQNTRDACITKNNKSRIISFAKPDTVKMIQRY